MYVDIHARHKNRKEELQLQTFYGQLQHLFVIRLPENSRVELGLEDEEPLTIFFAAIKSCVIDAALTINILDIHYFARHGSLDLVDVDSLQALVGRVPDGNRTRIVDRSGTLARAVGVEDSED